MKIEKKAIKHKMSVLDLTKSLGNISQACRTRGVSRSQFYEWKKRFKTHGIEGLKDLPSIVKNHPFTTPKETIEKIKNLALQHPSKGCKYLEYLLESEGIKLSSVTIQKHLDEVGFLFCLIKDCSIPIFLIVFKINS